MALKTGPKTGQQTYEKGNAFRVEDGKLLCQPPPAFIVQSRGVLSNSFMRIKMRYSYQLNNDLLNADDFTSIPENLFDECLQSLNGEAFKIMMSFFRHNQGNQLVCTKDFLIKSTGLTLQEMDRGLIDLGEWGNIEILQSKDPINQQITLNLLKSNQKG